MTTKFETGVGKLRYQLNNGVFKTLSRFLGDEIAVYTTHHGLKWQINNKILVIEIEWFTFK